MAWISVLYSKGQHISGSLLPENSARVEERKEMCLQKEIPLGMAKIIPISVQMHDLLYKEPKVCGLKEENNSSGRKICSQNMNNLRNIIFWTEKLSPILSASEYCLCAMPVGQCSLLSLCCLLVI